MEGVNLYEAFKPSKVSVFLRPIMPDTHYFCVAISEAPNDDYWWHCYPPCFSGHKVDGTWYTLAVNTTALLPKKTLWVLKLFVWLCGNSFLGNSQQIK
tara:strand:- start:381 stop:674 length:294 start_codon:yes stop_codon:yes gene_type:complete